MQFRDFEVRIPEGKEQPNGYVEIEHGKSFGIFIKNMAGLRSKVFIEINNQPCGEHLIESYDSKTVRTFVNDKVTTPFVYYTPNSLEAKKQKIYEIPEKYVGLVKVTFVPELLEVVEPEDNTPTDSIHRASEFDTVIKPVVIAPSKNVSSNEVNGGVATVLKKPDELKQTLRLNNEDLSARTVTEYKPNYTLAACIYLRLVPVPEQAPLSEINIPYHSHFPAVPK
jgi:hypothetical protein